MTIFLMDFFWLKISTEKFIFKCEIKRKKKLEKRNSEFLINFLKFKSSEEESTKNKK
jgi:hypothetical protein